MRILHKSPEFFKGENELLDYHHGLAQLCQVADRLGKRTLKKEMVRIRQKYTFLESSIEFSAAEIAEKKDKNGKN